MRNEDGAGNIIKPGDVCVRCSRSGKPEYCVFVGSVWGGKSSGGDYGRFINESGFTSVKYSNVLLAFDPMSDRRPKIATNELVRRFYEQGKTQKDLHIQE